MDLYALPPEEFTAARDEAAKADKALKGLRKPSVSAWVVNTLVRREPALVAQLTELGAALGQAQQDADPDALRELGKQRSQLVEAVTAQAVGLVDRPVSASVRGEVYATLEAALVDPASAEAVTSGHLTRALSFAGFGGVDLEGAVAAVPRPARQARSSKVEKLEQAALEAQGELDDAVRRAQAAEAAADRAQEALASAETERAAADEERTQAQHALERAEERARAAHSGYTAAKAAAEDAAGKAERLAARAVAAQEAAESARQALDAARRS